MFGFPKRYFKEHGTIWLLALVRYPSLRHGEVNPLIKPNLGYKAQAGDPLIVSAEPPIDLNIQDYYLQTTQTTVGEKIPYGQWYRDMPKGMLHPDYEIVQGFPFEDYATDWSVFRDMHYVETKRFDQIFQTIQLAHLQVAAKTNFNVDRIVPPAGWSIQAGGA